MKKTLPAEAWHLLNESLQRLTAARQAAQKAQTEHDLLLASYGLPVDSPAMFQSVQVIIPEPEEETP